MRAKFSFCIHAIKRNVLRNICKCEMIHCISEKPSGPMVNIWSNCSQRGKFSTICMWKDNLFRDGWHVLCSQGSIITAVAALKYGPRDTRSRRWGILATGRSAGRWSSIFGEASPWWVFCSGWVGKGGLASWMMTGMLWGGTQSCFGCSFQTHESVSFGRHSDWKSWVEQ